MSFEISSSSGLVDDRERQPCREDLGEERAAHGGSRGAMTSVNSPDSSRLYSLMRTVIFACSSTPPDS